MDATNGQKIFALHGDATHKDSLNISFRQQYPGLFNLLDSCPFHAFSSPGRRNICNRFRITEQTLEQVLLTYERLGEFTEAERRAADLARLLQVIEQVIAPAPKHKNGKKRKGGGKW